MAELQGSWLLDGNKEWEYHDHNHYCFAILETGTRCRSPKASCQLKPLFSYILSLDRSLHDSSDVALGAEEFS